MAIIKCKMCGGDLELIEGSSVCECEYCGTKQTVPTADNDKKLTLFARANRLRAANEFDKAAGVYENLVADFPEEAEAYWGLVLCRYGIEYVDDPATGKKIPTCHRSSFDSILEDEDFEQACENADAIARRVYREEAKAIEDIRRGILEISGREEPYDIFICYKETDDSGDRTVDSVLAQDVYDALTEKDYRVFFSRVSLEDKLGTEYEPYIFAALNSARVMLVFGTDYEHFNAVWVKNEWSRFLALMAGGQKKVLIPCYKDVDAYDMPKEFQRLQAQDMGKVGAVQDLLRGIGKILPKQGETVDQAVPQAQVTSPLSERGMLFLEDGDYIKAHEYFERALDSNPRDSRAYLGKVFAALRIASLREMEEKTIDLDSFKDFSRAMQFAEAEELDKLKELHDRATKKLQIKRVCTALAAKVKDEEERLERERREAEERLERERQAEEAARKEAEQQALLEQAREKAELVVAAISAKQNNVPSMQGQLDAAKQRAVALDKVCAEYDDVKEEIDQLRVATETLESQQEQLQGKRKRLGFFSGKEKKQIDAALAELERSIQSNREKAQETAQKLSGYSTKEAAEKALLTEKQTVIELQQKIEMLKDQGKGEYSYEQAVKMLKNDPYVNNAVFLKYPRMILDLAEQNNSVHLYFGRYPQAEDGEVSPIEWEVLFREPRRALLISKKGLHAISYDYYSYEDVTWEKCRLRSWLNSTFLNTAFSAEEQAMIPTVTVFADADPSNKYNTRPGNDTQDQLFLLSVPQANRYFSSDADRQCAPTAYAKATGCYVSDSGFCWWWLRSPSKIMYRAAAAVVAPDGDVGGNGNYADKDDHAVRPALWINLES